MYGSERYVLTFENRALREGGDDGRPIVVTDPDDSGHVNRRSCDIELWLPKYMTLRAPRVQRSEPCELRPILSSAIAANRRNAASIDGELRWRPRGIDPVELRFDWREAKGLDARLMDAALAYEHPHAADPQLHRFVSRRIAAAWTFRSASTRR